MEVELAETLAKLRLVIGFLGEREQFGWWQSSFFTQGSTAFLSPLFGRTMTLARCNGISQAAAMVHDERIGVGRVYHLFRLPEDAEQSIHKVLHDIEFGGIVDSKEDALDYLRKGSVSAENLGIGPTLVGDKKSMKEPKAWQIASGHYLYAFENGLEIFPYFTDIL
ncbi:MAG: BrxE family protein [Chloroflexi bacterium]|nr:BrxE family protein [Chloroflexota bacterium]